jgi:hypothetical protein
MDQSPPPFDPRAAAARFCAERAAHAELRRRLLALELTEPDSDTYPAPGALAEIWAEYLADGGSLGQLYGVAS